MSNLVECSVIKSKSQRAIWLLDEQNGSPKRTVGGCDEAFFKELLNSFLQFFQLYRREPEVPSVGGSTPFSNVNNMLCAWQFSTTSLW